MLVSGKELFQAARQGGYAVGAFNVNNMEIIQAIIEAAEEENSPVFLQASQGGIKYAGIEYIAGLAKTAAESVKVPVALNLDHGTSFTQVVQCVRHGFTAVMIDGSQHPYEENIALTQKVVEVAHPCGVSVEAELGKIGGVEDDISVDAADATFTDPQEAAEFAERTKVDALAIAIGTAHGVYKGEPKLDFDRLAKIREATDVPLVLHGASGIGDEAIRKAVSLGICKINIDTELRQAFTKAVQEVVHSKPQEFDPRKLLGPAREAMKEVVRAKMRLFGSAGRA
ncbi:MAG: class II fructose-1,6-bisphosphate aldolase [Limnochordia bacterium]|nr:class II fructose-1,6-bisphosphate aldolase [Bacillota bacterium]NLL08717.1 class II fructose-1,6-bisphosphate aldolase [Bacillota bacterium]HBG09697.1 fructose-1,6-bisphosphate aldolase, class II [Bacillota bacterium]